ncbi:MAG TPA: glycosyltransferase family 1 protein [Bryobacteraceae bacterium]|nr:glycosyltransferase family 1 protein [Bryobacteraceae bacterium]
MPLHIAMDVRRVRDFGIGTYIRNLTRALARLDPENRYTLVARPADFGEFEGLGPNFELKPCERTDSGFQHNLLMPRFFGSLKANLYHIPLNSVAWWMPRPYVLTIHDMSTLLFAGRKDFRHMLHAERYRRGAARAARIITVSNTTRRDVESVLHVPSERITTIYSAPDPAFTSSSDGSQEQQIMARYSISFPYILYAGTIRARKNIPRLIEAFAVLRHELEQHARYKDLRLVIIGDELSNNPAVRQAAAHSRVASAVRFLGFVPTDTLRVFYRAAEAFAFPSLYEGFGLAPLEAMACGTPVVASNLPALVEAVGEAAELVSPDNVFDIARGLREVLLDENRRRWLVEAGRAQVERFHWETTARESLCIYRETANNKSNTLR